MQPPSIGRIVHYYPVADTGKRSPYPAIVTNVNEDGSVNLAVFNDAIHELMPQELEPIGVWHSEEGLNRWCWPSYCPPLTASAPLIVAQNSGTTRPC